MNIKIYIFKKYKYCIHFLKIIRLVETGSTPQEIRPFHSEPYSRSNAYQIMSQNL